MVVFPLTRRLRCARWLALTAVDSATARRIVRYFRSNGSALTNAVTAYAYDRSTARLVIALTAFQSALAASGVCVSDIAVPAQRSPRFESRR